MISLGSKTWGSSPGITLTFEYEKQRSGANMQYRAKITVGTLPTSGASYFGYPIYLKLHIGGTLRITTTLKAATPNRWNTAITYTSSWYTIENKTSGTTAVSFNVYSGSGSSRNNTYTYSMEVDPAASVLTASNGTLGTAQTLTLTKYDADFTHTITYVCGNDSGTICTKSASTSVSWTPALALASNAPNGTAATIALTATTYNGDAVIGTSSKTITADIPASIVPTVSLAISDDAGYLATYGGYVQTKSTPKVVVTAEGAYGSSIRTYSTTIDGGTYNTASFTTGVLKTSGTLTVKTTITDSRGRTATASETITSLAYNPPRISSLSVQRCNQNGTLNSSGAYLKVVFSSAISSLNSKNTATYMVKYKKTSATSYTSAAVTAYANNYAVTDGSYVFAADTASSYDISFIAEDAFTSSSKGATGSSIKKFFSWFNGGRGWAFGKVAEKEDALDVAWDAYFDKDVYIKGAPVRNKRCICGQNGNSDENPWHKVGTYTAEAVNDDIRISFKVTFAYGSVTRFGTLDVFIRTENANGANAFQSVIFESDTGLDTSNFVLAYSGTGVGSVYELWVKLSAYRFCQFEVLSESSRTAFVDKWVLYNSISLGEAAAPTSGYTQVSASRPNLLGAYPVGSYYISHTDTSPASIFGGTWHRIESRFLWACPAESEIGLTAGEMTHTLTTDEMPEHDHQLVFAKSSSTGGTKNILYASTLNKCMASSGRDNVHIEVAGANAAHNNMPPYVNVAIWRRTA